MEPSEIKQETQSKKWSQMVTMEKQQILDDSWRSSLLPDYKHKTVYCVFAIFMNSLKNAIGDEWQRDNNASIRQFFEWDKWLCMQGDAQYDPIRVYYGIGADTETAKSIIASYYKQKQMNPVKKKNYELEKTLKNIQVSRFEELWIKEMELRLFNTKQDISMDITPSDKEEPDSPLASQIQKPKTGATDSKRSHSSDRRHPYFKETDPNFTAALEENKKAEDTFFEEVVESEEVQRNIENLKELAVLAPPIKGFIGVFNNTFGWESMGKKHELQDHGSYRDVVYYVLCHYVKNEKICWNPTWPINIHHGMHHLNPKLKIIDYMDMYGMSGHILCGVATKLLRENEKTMNKHLCQTWIVYVTQMLDTISRGLKYVQQQQYKY